MRINNIDKILITIFLCIAIASLGFISTVNAIRNGAGYAQRWYRPLIGCIQIQAILWYENGKSIQRIEGYYCTIGYAVKENVTGKLGFITAAHCTEYSTTPGPMYYWTLFQPSYDYQNGGWNNYVGQPKTVFTNYDLEFVEIAEGIGIVPAVLYATNSSASYPLIRKAIRWNELWNLYIQAYHFGETIYVSKTGMSTGTTDGYILRLEDSCIHNNTSLQYCIWTTTYIEGGDSGAPLYIPPSANSYYVYLLGHIRGVRWELSGYQYSLAISVEAAYRSGYTVITYS